MNHNFLLEAVNAIDISRLTYDEWLSLGMALKNEGFPCSVWDDLSKLDRPRYIEGDCEKRWNSFHDTPSPVTGGTIFHLASKCGWKPQKLKSQSIAWDEEIDNTPSLNGNAGLLQSTKDTPPAEQLMTFINTLFNPNEYVGYVTKAIQKEDGRWAPTKGSYTRTASDIITSLLKYPDDFGAAMGDYKEEAGAWIRINPLDGSGVADKNVSSYRYALVECDEIPVTAQQMYYEKFQLPIATLVFSGGKSLHAIVKIDANSYSEYTERVKFLYDYLAEHGVTVDTANRNPSRLSRMPGVYRNGKQQTLIGINLGMNSWEEWYRAVNTESDDLPDVVPLSRHLHSLPAPPVELIHGILRKGHKMLISGASKVGKSFLLMELTIAIAEGKSWLGFQCEKSRVLYINLEIDGNSAFNRFAEIYGKLEINDENSGNIGLWNLRGHSVPLTQLAPSVINRATSGRYDVIIIDPIYKVITGDENNATEMGRFCNCIDDICNQTGCSVIYVHHHSKGTQGSKQAIDRSSGSGVFGRDPDAILDIIEITIPEDVKAELGDEASEISAFRMSSSLREFKNIKDTEFYFKYPIHTVDTTGRLATAKTIKGNSKESSITLNLLKETYATLKITPDTKVTLSDMADLLNVSDRTVRNHVKRYTKVFAISNSVVTAL